LLQIRARINSKKLHACHTILGIKANFVASYLTLNEALTILQLGFRVLWCEVCRLGSDVFFTAAV
jgi:hypothetical protein